MAISFYEQLSSPHRFGNELKGPGVGQNLSEHLHLVNPSQSPILHVVCSGVLGDTIGIPCVFEFPLRQASRPIIASTKTYRAASFPWLNDTYPINYSYDNDGLLTFAGDLYLGRNREDGLLEETLLGNIATTWVHNTFAEPIHCEARFGTDTLYQVDFARDSLGRITQKIETIDSVTKTIEYTYDLAGRLQSETVNGSITTYSYDDNGNRLNRIAAAGNEIGIYDDQDRALSYGEFDYSYNPNGWVESKTNRLNGQITTYNYDVFGNLRAVLLPDGRDIEYLIDGQNRRIGKIVDGVLEKGWLYADQLNPIAETDGAGKITQRFVYGSRVNVPDYVVDVVGNRTLQIISDHLGSPRLVVDVNSGEVAQQVEHDAWGRVLEGSNDGWLVFGFAGGIWDSDTGLVRFGARDYDPLSGRWMARDPIGFGGENANLYGYVAGDPVDNIDSSGLYVESAMDLAFLAYDVKRIVDRYQSGCGIDSVDVISLFADVLGLAVPVATGLGIYVRMATRVDDGLKLGRRIGDRKAVRLLRRGEDVFSSSEAKAKQLVNAAQKQKGVIRDPAHGEGFFKHYHDKLREMGHSFFGDPE